MNRISFNRDYDDPYTILAYYLIAYYPKRSLKKIMTNNIYVKSMVLREANALDISGRFLDCIDEEIIRKEHLRPKNAQLKQLGEFYFSELDLPRLRRELKKRCEEMMINLD